MTLEHLHEQNRRLRRDTAQLAREVSGLREQLSGAWAVGVLVYALAGLTSGIVGAFVGNIIFWSLK